MATDRQLLDELLRAEKVTDVERILFRLEDTLPDRVGWLAVGGRTNNRGQIDVASDAARSAIERVTNAQDAILELEHLIHRGLPVCRSPREAAEAWLGVPERDGLAGLSQKQRQALARRVTVRLQNGDGTHESRCLSVIDTGIGVRPSDISNTILSLGASNKIQKHYLAGTYGQGGSSTLNFCKYSLIVSRRYGDVSVGFTVVKYLDLPAELFKTGHYVYLTLDENIPTADATAADMDHGTIIVHFGFDLTKYPSPVGPRSLYGALNRVLFDPVTPVWFENRVRQYNRVIKGSRSALNGAVDQDDDQRGPDLAHSMPMFTASLGDFGRIGIEYWLLSAPQKGATKPSESFVDAAKPIILTHNGQNQGELSALLIKKNADLPYLRNRLIVHVTCDHLSPEGKRLLFASTREQSREGFMADRISREIISALRSDDVLDRLNAEAREQSLKDQDEAAEKRVQRQVARLLNLAGLKAIDTGGASRSPDEASEKRTGGKPNQKRAIDPIPVKEPPSFIRIVWEENGAIPFFPGQRRYIRLETDAAAEYHDPNDFEQSKLNVILGPGLLFAGSSPLKQGRMRLIVECEENATIGEAAGIRVELLRKGLQTLSDERGYSVVPPPPPKSRDHQSTIPQFKLIPVEGPKDDRWVNISEDDTDIAKHALNYEYNQGVLYVYYSIAFPRFAAELAKLEKQDAALSKSFAARYGTWLAVHSILHYQQREADRLEQPGDATVLECDRAERCRLATIAAMVAAQEVRAGVPFDED